MLNFDLQATQTAQGDLRLAVAGSPAGELEPLLANWPALTTAGVLAASPAEQERLGVLLAAALPARLWTLWHAALDRAGGEGLRLRLRADPPTAALPWELLYDAERALFPARDALTPLVRYAEGPIPLLPFVPGAQATLLLTGASPSALPSTFAESLAAIQATVQGSPLVVAALEPHLRSDRLGVLVTARQPVVVHFHGEVVFDSRRGESCLLLEDSRGTAAPLPASLLAATLRNQGVQLVVPAGGQGVESSAEPAAELWMELAQALVRAGIPAVLTLRGRLSADLAGAFLGAFYGALAAGRPYDVATNLARNVAALAALDSAQPGAWLQPLLFMRRDDGRLWQGPQPTAVRPRFERGELVIYTVNASVFVAGDMINSTFDLRGAQIGAGSAAGAVSGVQSGAQPDAEVQRQLAQVQGQMGQLLTLQAEQRAVLDALAQGQLNEMDLNTVLAGLQELFVEVQRHNDLLLAAGESIDLVQTEAALADSGLGVKQRFKVTLPLLLWFLSYEAEFEWDGRVDLKAAWEKLRG